VKFFEPRRFDWVDVILTPIIFAILWLSTGSTRATLRDPWFWLFWLMTFSFLGYVHRINGGR
jgi:hypothetical protein